MTTYYKSRAVVFGKKDANEADRFFSVFTDNFGRLNILAKAIRKITSKLRGGIDVFSIVDIEFIQGKNRKTLTDAVLIERFSNISKNLEKFKFANEIGEILDNFIKGEEKDEKIFALVKEVFSKLNDNATDIKKGAAIYQYFLWNALSLMGYRSEVEKCVSCLNKLTPYDVYFSGKEGGIICGKCLAGDSKALKINSDIVKILRLILLKDWQTLLRLRVGESSEKLMAEVSQNALNAFSPVNY